MQQDRQKPRKPRGRIQISALKLEFFHVLGACKAHFGAWEALSDVSGSRTLPRDQLGSILHRFCVHLGGIWEPLGSHFGAILHLFGDFFGMLFDIQPHQFGCTVLNLRDIETLSAKYLIH